MNFFFIYLLIFLQLSISGVFVVDIVSCGQLGGHGGAGQFDAVFHPSVYCDSITSTDVQREVSINGVVYHSWGFH